MDPRRSSPNRSLVQATPFIKNEVQNDFLNKVYKASSHYPTAVHLDKDLQTLFARGSTFYTVLKLGENLPVRLPHRPYGSGIHGLK